MIYKHGKLGHSGLAVFIRVHQEICTCRIRPTSAAVMICVILVNTQTHTHIGVARILSGVHFFSKKVDDLF